jgi:hypothetical protein
MNDVTGERSSTGGSASHMPTTASPAPAHATYFEDASERTAV